MRVSKCVPRVLLGLGLTMLPLVAPAEFYSGKADGWFWYREPPASRPRDPPPPAEPAPPAEAAPSRPADPEPAPLSVAWMRTHLDRVRDRAIDDPTPENVAAYFYLQRVALDKSERFAQVAASVVQGNPDLDENTRRPTATFAANLMNAQAGAARDALLAQLARQVAVWFFFRSDCPYCEAQAPILEVLARRYGFTVLAISLDRRALPSGTFPDFRADQGQAAQLGVRVTPSLFLVRPDGPQFAPVAQGMVSLADLQERLITAAERAGWISPAQVTPTRAVAAQAATVPTLAEGLPTEDPALLIARLQALLGHPSPPDSGAF